MRFDVMPWAVVALALAACTPEPPVGTAPPEVPPTPSTASTADAASPAAAAPSTLFVREVRVDCEGEGPQKCLQIRASAADPWNLLYDGIEGFHYEDGNAYELRVSIELVRRPPADATSKRYHLVEIVSKTKVP